MLRLITGLKYRGRLDSLRIVQELLCLAYVPDAALPAEIVVPVPLARGRLLRRGFNQSLEMSRLLARRNAVPLEARALRRVRAAAPQARMGGTERRSHLRGAFQAEPRLVEGRRVLLVDDVATTGATLDECALELRRAGAARVEALVLARTPLYITGGVAVLSNDSDLLDDE